MNGDQLNTSDLPPISDPNEIVDWYGYNDRSKEFEKLLSAPTNAGTYHVKLNEKFLLALSNGNPNYYFTKEPTNTDEGPAYVEEDDEPEFNYGGYFTYIISPVEVASAKLSGNGVFCK